MEKGFYHPERGYWQTVSVPSDDILASYPHGTVEVPMKPDADYEWQDGEWVHVPLPPPTPEEIRAAMPPLTARQLRLGLIGGGFSLSQVGQAIDAIPDEQHKAVAEIEWQYAAQFERLHPLIEQVGTSIGLTPEQIDAMWEQALSL